MIPEEIIAQLKLLSNIDYLDERWKEEEAIEALDEIFILLNKEFPDVKEANQ